MTALTQAERGELVRRLRHMAKLCQYGGLNDLLNDAAAALSALQNDEHIEGTHAELQLMLDQLGFDFEAMRDARNAANESLWMANRDKESILARLNTDLGEITDRPKGGEINETLRAGAAGALTKFKHAIVEAGWIEPRGAVIAEERGKEEA